MPKFWNEFLGESRGIAVPSSAHRCSGPASGPPDLHSLVRPFTGGDEGIAMQLDLDGHVVLVTGGASGLGHSCAEAVSRFGADVALVSQDIDDIAYASDRLHALGEGDIFSLETDVRDPSRVASFVDETVEQYGRIDHVITGPRPVEPGELLAVSDEDWFRAFDRSFMSVVWTLRETFVHLDDSDYGTVVTVTSPVLGALADELAVSNAFGNAVAGLVRTQARAFAPSVRVNAVVPGAHDTDDLVRLLTDLVDAGQFDTLEDAWAAVLADTPLETPGDPLDLGKLVAYLSSEHAGFVNGATIPVDGGARR